MPPGLRYEARRAKLAAMISREKFNDALREIRAIYADLAARPIQRSCELRTECCQFKLTGLVPQVTSGEALLAAKALKGAGRKQLPERADGACPMLHPVTSKCMIYADRPFGCRTHFCDAAGGPYTRKEVLDLIRRLEEVDYRLGRDGPRALPDAVHRALRTIEGMRDAR
jgi:Fe-S-cluster containining protein